MIRATRPQLPVAHIFFYLLILSSPLLAYRFDVGLLQVSLSRLFLILGLLALISRQILSGRIKFFNDKWMIPLLFLLLFKVISLIYASNQTFAIQDVFVFIEHILYYYFTIMVLQDWSTLKKGLNLYILSAVLPVCLGIYQLAGFLNQTPYPLPFQNYLAIAPANLRITTHIWGYTPETHLGLRLNRISAAFADPNTLGIFLVLISSFVIPVFLKNYKARLKILIMFCLLVMQIELFLTMSISAVLISLVMIITMMFITKLQTKHSFKKLFAIKREQRIIAFVLIELIVCFWVINSFTPLHFIDTFVSRWNQDITGVKGAMPMHLKSIPIGLEIVSKHPWGYGKITQEWSGYYYTHFSYFLLTLVENGILAFLALLFFCCIQIKDVVTWTRRVSPMNSKCPSVDYVFRLGSLPFLVSVGTSLVLYDTLMLPWLWIGFGLIRSYLVLLRKSHYNSKIG